MDEEVLAAGVRLNEPEPLLAVEPAHGPALPIPLRHLPPQDKNPSFPRLGTGEGNKKGPRLQWTGEKRGNKSEETLTLERSPPTSRV